jgi:hypothetical protein
VFRKGIMASHNSSLRSIHNTVKSLLEDMEDYGDELYVAIELAVQLEEEIKNTISEQGDGEDDE